VILRCPISPAEQGLPIRHQITEVGRDLLTLGVVVHERGSLPLTLQVLRLETHPVESEKEVRDVAPQVPVTNQDGRVPPLVVAIPSGLNCDEVLVREAPDSAGRGVSLVSRHEVTDRAEGLLETQPDDLTRVALPPPSPVALQATAPRTPMTAPTTAATRAVWSCS
jgi:hypothetical protein